jgi:hypothetical protein
MLNRKALSTILVAVIITVIVVAAILIAAFAFFIFYFPSANQKTQSFANTDFNALEIRSAFNVNITQSNTYSITITANQRTLDQIEVKQDGNILTIDVKPGAILGSFNAKAQISMPKLDNITLSGATHGTAQGFNSQDPFIAKLSGASSIQITNFQAADIIFDVSGASTLITEGLANDLSATVTGASSLKLFDLTINNANVTLSGASHAEVYLNGKLNVDASGASSLQYTGQPNLGTVNTSGASSVTKK